MISLYKTRDIVMVSVFFGGFFFESLVFYLSDYDYTDDDESPLLSIVKKEVLDEKFDTSPGRLEHIY